MVAPASSPEAAPRRYSLRARSTPRGDTPAGSRPGSERASRRASGPAPPTPGGASDVYVPTPAARGAGDAQESAAATDPRSEYALSGKADTQPRAEYTLRNRSSDAQALAKASGSKRARGAAVKEVESDALEALGSGRHERRRSRKSFSRSVLHPRSPCARAARAGISMDPKAALLGMSGGTATPHFVAMDAFGNERHTLASDGCVTSPSGRVLAYIEADGTVGSADLEYLGEVTAAAPPTSMGFITNAEDELVAKLDYGRALIQDPQGSTLAEFRKSGHVTGHLGASCGVLEGFDFHKLQAAAAYLMLVEPSFVRGS